MLELVSSIEGSVVKDAEKYMKTVSALFVYVDRMKKERRANSFNDAGMEIRKAAMKMDRLLNDLSNVAGFFMGLQDSCGRVQSHLSNQIERMKSQE